MFLVPILHILGNGGVLANTPWMSSQYLAGWLLETVALCAVDCFALISGYVGSTAKFRWSRVGNLWLGIVFYTLLLTALFAVWMPEVVSKRTWFGAIFPITSNQYWFMTAYVGMFFLHPPDEFGAREGEQTDADGVFGGGPGGVLLPALSVYHPAARLPLRPAPGLQHGVADYAVPGGGIFEKV